MIPPTSHLRTVSDWTRFVEQALVRGGAECGDSGSHALRLVELASGMDRQGCLREWTSPFRSEARADLLRLLGRRLKGEPLQYLTGEEGFWNSSFLVGPGVLIPRRETECLVEALLARCLSPKSRIAELGPGTGNIGISVLQERPSWEWHAFELNQKSIPYLQKNRFRLLPREAGYYWTLGDFFALAHLSAPFDWIVTNPPYIPSAEISGLSAEVRQEPVIALDGGEKGLDFYEALAAQWTRLVRPGGGLLAEIGSEQEQSVLQIFSRRGFGSLEIIRDYAGLARVLCVQHLHGT